MVSGVEQLYWGLLAAQRIRAGAQTAVAGAEQLAGTGSPEAKIALVEARQALQQVEAQFGDLQDQLAILLDVPTCTTFELVEPPAPVAPVKCADEAVSLALASSPDVREAQQNVVKAEAAVAAAKVDYLSNIAVVGGYANNNMSDVIQPNYSYVGVVGNWTLVDWGKRLNTVRERDELVAMAHLKVQQTQDQVRQDGLKAFRDYAQSGVAFDLAGQMLEGRKEAEKAAAAPAAKFAAAKDVMLAQVDYVKADLAHRVAYVKLMALSRAAVTSRAGPRPAPRPPHRWDPGFGGCAARCGRGRRCATRCPEEGLNDAPSPVDVVPSPAMGVGRADGHPRVGQMVCHSSTETWQDGPLNVRRRRFMSAGQAKDEGWVMVVPVRTATGPTLRRRASNPAYSERRDTRTAFYVRI